MQKLGMARSDRGLFFEKQAQGSNYCQVHAINNTYGDDIVTPEALQQFVSAQRREHPDNICWNHVLFQDRGSSDDVIKLWLESLGLTLFMIDNIPAHPHDLHQA
jgi:hypothetical protein